MSSGPSNSGGGGGAGRRPFFNDRRFTIAGPQRLRQNVQDLLSQFNRQFAADNPHLLHELADQLNRLQDLLTTNPNPNPNANANTPAVHQNVNAINATGGRESGEIALNFDDQAGPSNGEAVRQRFREVQAEIENELNVSGAGSQYMMDDDDEDENDDDDVDDGANALPNTMPNDSVILNMEIDLGGNVRVEGIAPAGTGQANDPPLAQPQQQAANGQAAATNPDAEWQRLVAALRAPEMQRILRMIINFGPFLFILLAKWMLTYAAGIIMLVCLFATFFYAENVVETVIAASRTQPTQKWRLLSTIILMVLNVGALYFFFSSDKLYLALIFQPTMPLLEEGAKHLSFLTILWLIITTDVVAKFIFILAKCLVVSGPTLVATHRRKAQTYQWLEYSSHLYRHWLPTLPWSYYLTASSESGTFVHNGLCTLLFLVYLLLKVKLFREKLRRWWKSTVSLMRPTSFGYSPSTVELMKTGPTCSICYGEFAKPVQLSCKHIFCEECVTTWLDKQKTCPMCRTQVITGDNDWKDGKTSLCVQLV